VKYQIGILASHPIQYQAPIFRALARMSDTTVFYAHRQTGIDQANAGFGQPFEWDVDLHSGFQSQYLDNVSPRPSVSHFRGCDTPEIASIISRGNYDGFVVTGWHLKSYWQAVFACRRQGVPVIVRGDSQLSSKMPLLKRMVKKVVYPGMLKNFDGYLYVGERNREYLSHYGVLCTSPDWY